MTTFGYARVSTKDQNIARQLDALRAFPMAERNIYIDYFTGVSFERPRYRALLRRLRAEDVLVIKSIDRLGRNYSEILEQWRFLTRNKRIDVVVLDMPLLDTRTSRGDVTGVFIADVVLQLLSYVAQVERENIHQRQAEGIAAAQRRGVRFGRPRKPRPENWDALRDAILTGAMSRAEAARQAGVCRNTLDSWLRADGAAD